MTPEELGEAWREDRGEYMARRRLVIGLNLFSIACLGIIALYQAGLLKEVPEPPGFDAEKVHGSAQGYSLFATPDSLLGVASYAGTAVVTALGTPDRHRTRPWLSAACGAKVALDAALAASMLVVQPVKYRAFSFWAVVSALASLGAVPSILPEMASAIRTMRDQGAE